MKQATDVSKDAYMGMLNEPDVHRTCYRHQLSSSNWLNSVQQNDSASGVSQKRNQSNTQFTKPDRYSSIPIDIIINLSPRSFDNRQKNKPVPTALDESHPNDDVRGEKNKLMEVYTCSLDAVCTQSCSGQSHAV
ncbi:hypothetical protein T265_07082 [Opisthorchis viverrini]|uniref:Uncharacterized protein n=1 Tax=Opisthorchis viverrini TaxID=6198 RepID=A0A074ZE59_OPIVI|nr:hypothetical protein T265_07082 [Opisthorchis viverrini]KER25458.1 hypothetical protein T265_07082 [Opisthorchis viverrini]